MTTASSPPLNPFGLRAAPSASGRTLAPGARRVDGLSTGQRRAAVGAIVAAHLAGVWGLMQVGEVREAARDVMPMFVDLIAPAAPPKPPLPVPPAPVPPQPVAKRPPPPAPLIAAAPSPAPAAFTAPPPPPTQEAPSPTPAPAPVVVAAPAPPAPTPAPSPPTIAPSDVQYLVEPAPDYPRASVRNHETGRVLVLVLISEAGQPSQVQVARSSGFARLDEAAVSAVRKSRFRPYTINGQPVAAWTNVPIDFAVEK